MLIPLGTDRPLLRPTLVTYVLVMANLLAAIVQAAIGEFGTGSGSSIAPMVLNRGHAGEAWRFVSYAFLHGGFGHLLGNMAILWVFGPNVEDRFGRIGFTLFYLGGAVVSGAVHTLVSPVGVIGASGAISAVTGAYLVLFPRTHIKCLVFFIIIGIFMIPAWWFIGFAIALNIFMTGFAGNSNIATEAHLGGYGFGIAVCVLLLWRRVFPREPYDLFTIGKQAVRRRQLREASHASQARVTRKVGEKAKPNPQAEKLAHARAAVTAAIADGDLKAAGARYKALADEFAASPIAVTLSRQAQYDLGNHFFSDGDYQSSAFAYDRFLEAYPNDREAPRVGLMLALINVRYLNDPVRGRLLLDGLASKLDDEGDRALAGTLARELG